MTQYMPMLNLSLIVMIPYFIAKSLTDTLRMCCIQNFLLNRPYHCKSLDVNKISQIYLQYKCIHPHQITLEMCLYHFLNLVYGKILSEFLYDYKYQSGSDLPFSFFGEVTLCDNRDSLAHNLLLYNSTSILR